MRCRIQKSRSTEILKHDQTKHFEISKGYLLSNIPETNSSPLKIDPWKRRLVLETIIFRGYVSFREGNIPVKIHRLTNLSSSECLGFFKLTGFVITTPTSEHVWVLLKEKRRLKPSFLMSGT